MKKTLTLVLCVLMLCTAVTAMGETVSVDLDYDGTYLPFEDFGFRILVPSDWAIYETEDAYFAAGTEDRSMLMEIDVFANEEDTMDTILEAFQSEEGYTDVEPVYYNGIPFVTFTYAPDNFFGAVTLTGDDGYSLYFTFTPNDDGLRTLGTKIMASIDTEGMPVE